MSTNSGISVTEKRAFRGYFELLGFDALRNARNGIRIMARALPHAGSTPRASKYTYEGDYVMKRVGVW